MLNYSGTCSGAPADHFVTSGSPGSTEETETEEVAKVEGSVEGVLKNGLQRLQKLKEVFEEKKIEQG